MHKDYRTKLAARGWHVSFLDNPTGPSVPAIYRTGDVMNAQPLTPFLERVSLGHFTAETPLLDAESVMLEVALGEELVALDAGGTPSLTKRGWATIGGETPELATEEPGTHVVEDAERNARRDYNATKAMQSLVTPALVLEIAMAEDARPTLMALGRIAYGIANAMEAAR